MGYTIGKTRRRRTDGGRPGIGALAIAGLLAGTVQLLNPLSAAAAPSPGAATAATRPTPSLEALAAQQAKATGKDVPVVAEYSPNSTVTAHPNGTFTLRTTPDATQVQQGGAWVPLDATLLRNGDGSLSPKAALSSVVFSSGGAGPVATLTAPSGQHWELSWPGSLPTPTVSGDTATYAEVYPGVDLQLTATQTGGYTEHLIIKNATAAADPRLADIHFGLKTTGLRLSKDSSGGPQALDPSGRVVFTSPTPTMWSRHTPGANGGAAAAGLHAAGMAGAGAGGSAVPADDPAPATALPVQVSTNGLDLLPPKSALSGPGIDYPVVIDPGAEPQWPTTDGGWTWVGSNESVSHWEDSNNTYDTKKIAREGYDDWCSDGSSGCSAFGKTRTIYSIGNLSGLSGKHVTKATFSLTEIVPTSGGSLGQVDIHGAGPFNSNTVWSNQPTPWSTVSASATFPQLSGSSGQANQNFDLTTMIKDAVTNGYTSQTLVLEAHDESNDSYYRKFDLSSGTNNPAMEIDYWANPATPTNLGMTDGTTTTSCNTTSPGTWVNASDSSTVTLNASLPTPDSPSLGTEEVGSFWYHQSYNNSSSSWVNLVSGWITLQSAPQPVSVTLGVHDGEAYQWQVYADNSGGYNSGAAAPSASTSCWFRVDLTAPGAPSVTSTSVPTVYNGTTQSGSIQVSASDGGANPSGVKAFAYVDNGASLNPGDSSVPTVTASNGTATIPVSASHWGTNWVWIATEDNAGNWSQPVHYDFYVQQGSYSPALKTGDLDGDGLPDFAMVDSDGAIRVFSNPETIAATNNETDPAGGTVTRKPTDAPNGVSFTGAVVAHNGSFSGGNCDDLVVIQGGSLTQEQNLQCTTGASAQWTAIPGVGRPSATGNTADYNASDWSSVQQAIVLPATPATNNRPALVTLENDNGTESVWEFVATTAIGHFSQAIPLASGSYWSGVTLVSPGNINGAPALWVRDNGAGSLTQYPNVESWNNLTGIPTGGLSLASSGYDSGTFPMLTSDGAVDTSGAPALWAAGPSGVLYQIPSTLDANGNPVLGTADLVSHTGWSNRWLLSGSGADTVGLDPATGTSVGFTSNHSGTANAAATFNGSSSVERSSTTAVDTSASYTVSAWVKLSATTTGSETLVCQPTAAGHQAFYLEYNATNGWEFQTTPNGGGAWPTTGKALGTGTGVGNWVHLTGVYDESAGQISLYVNGALAGSAQALSPVPSVGPLTIGACSVAGSTTLYNQVNGAISDVRVYPFALSGSQVTKLYNGQSIFY